MQLFIPSCGDRIILTGDWQFVLRDEHRNRKFAIERHFIKEKDDFGAHWWDNTNDLIVGLPIGTILECDRVYIRTSNKQYANAEDSHDSITWKVVLDGKAKMNQRFWVKLVDANKIECEVESLYRDRQ